MTVYLSLGTNLGDKNRNLQQAITLIEEEIGCLSAVSSVYETEPWGFQSDNMFLNQVVAVETTKSPNEILALTQHIEKQIGRTEKTHHTYMDRLIDIDLILYGDCVIKTEKLEIPHPLFHQRRFVLEPLNEIAPDLVHPVLKKTVKQLYRAKEKN